MGSARASEWVSEAGTDEKRSLRQKSLKVGDKAPLKHFRESDVIVFAFYEVHLMEVVWRMN